MVSIKPATLAAFCSALRTTFAVGLPPPARPRRALVQVGHGVVSRNRLRPLDLPQSRAARLPRALADLANDAFHTAASARAAGGGQCGSCRHGTLGLLRCVTCRSAAAGSASTALTASPPAVADHSTSAPLPPAAGLLHWAHAPRHAPTCATMPGRLTRSPRRALSLGRVT